MIENKKIKKIIPKDEGGSGESQGFLRRYFSFHSLSARRLYIFLITLGLVVAILSYVYAPEIGIELGSPSPRTIKANRGIEFEDVAQTEEDRNLNEAEVEDIYIYDIDILNGVPL